VDLMGDVEESDGVVHLARQNLQNKSGKWNKIDSKESYYLVQGKAVGENESQGQSPLAVRRKGGEKRTRALIECFTCFPK
jgi:hypothetical protein